MSNNIQERLDGLKAEFSKGQERLNELELEANQLKNTLLRISGAIQVLEEIVQEQPAVENGVSANSK